MDFARNLLGNNACAEDGHTVSNPLTRAIDNLIQGPNLHRIDHMNMNPEMMMGMEDAWDMAYVHAQEQPMIDAWAAAQMHGHIQPHPGHMQHFEEAWTHAQQPMIENFEQAWNDSHEDSQMKHATQGILNALMMNPDPKYRNSEFFKFVEKLHVGKAKIQDNQLIEEDWGQLWSSASERPGQIGQMQAAWQNSKEQERDMMMEAVRQAWNQSREVPMEAAWDQSQAPMEAAWDSSQGQMEEAWQATQEPSLDQVWDSADGKLTAEEEHMFENIWKGIELNEEEMQAVLKKWSQAWPAQAEEYTFASQNPYVMDQNPMEIAREKVRIGDISEAILALEAVVTLDPDSSEAWRLLGQMHAENDEDDKAISAFLKGYEADPYNLETLLWLGISCTNQFNMNEALSHLKSWLLNNPEYAHMQPTSTQISFSEQVIDLFQQAAALNSSDINLHQALGVLHFLNRDFEQALHAFKVAVGLNPQDHTLWNKIGAAYSNLKDGRAAIENYSQALDLRPSYVRAWVNTGIAYANQKDWANAARFYLCALSLNPGAQHLWNYLTTAFACMNRMDLVSKIEQRDPLVFKNEFDIITKADLQMLDNWGQGFAEQFQ